jgi:hypothetical protein
MLEGVGMVVVRTGFGVVEEDWYLPPAVNTLVLLFLSVALFDGERRFAVLPKPNFYLGSVFS